ncbi:MAG TPA: tetratricopeptide repeat protein [Polyangiaceae bacterium]|nr:tetratricopeptide repeat protein [Polyangiaceae bacterium]
MAFCTNMEYFGRAMIDEFDEELRELKREIIETRGLIIKTNNLTNALSADLKSIAKRQQGYERRLVWNSATAYVVFVLVVFVALKLAWDARVDAVRAETEQTRQAVDRLSRELKEAQKRDEERAKAEARAASFYELIRQGKRAEVVEQFEALNKEPLTKTELAVFADAVERARGELSIMAYHQGLDHARVGRWHEAAQSLEEALRYKDDASHSPLARYNLADAYRHLARQRDAIPILIQLSEASPDKEVMDDATFLLAQCLIDIQAWNDAKNTLRSFTRRFSDSPYFNEVRTHLAEISLRH